MTIAPSQNKPTFYLSQVVCERLPDLHNNDRNVFMHLSRMKTVALPLYHKWLYSEIEIVGALL